MFKFNKKKFCITLLLPSVCLAYAADENKKLPTAVADNYLRSFPSEVIAETTDKKEDFNIKTVRPPKLGPQNTRATIFNAIFTKSDKVADVHKNMELILNQYAWNDLKLFYGSTSAIDFNLINRINKTITVAGEAALAILLVTPTSNIDKLLERQKKVKLISEKKETLAQIRSLLSAYKQAENSLLSLYNVTDPLYTKEYRKYMEDYYYAKAGDPSNKSASWLEFKKRFFRDFWGIGFKFTYPYFSALLFECLAPLLTGKSLGKIEHLPGVTIRKYHWTSATPIYGGIYKWDIMSYQYEKFDRLGRNNQKYIDTTGGKFYLGFACVLPEIIYIYYAYLGVQNYIEYSHTLRNLALRMSDVQLFLKTAKSISDYVASDPELEAVYGPSLVSIRKLLARSGDSTELGSMIKHLMDLPLKRWSYFFNNAGKLLASYTIFVDNRDSLADAMYDLGELDAYAGVATLVNESKEYYSENSFTFVKFLTRSEKQTPYIKLTEMWNPFIDAKIAVANSVEIGDNTRNIILTGPNAGGKSIFLTGVTISLLLSQTFGIAPSKDAMITPFDKINTYIDVSDDVAAGNSLFMAEVIRAQAHINMLKTLSSNQFAFTIFDEPFSGTNPIEGAAAEYSILEALATYKNSLSIVATHYPIVMLLEDKAQNLGFKNYKVYITEDGHKLKYHYKIIPGKSNQAIAIRILEEQGFDSELLTRAKDIIKNPKNYEARF